MKHLIEDTNGTLWPISSIVSATPDPPNPRDTILPNPTCTVVVRDAGAIARTITAYLDEIRSIHEPPTIIPAAAGYYLVLFPSPADDLATAEGWVDEPIIAWSISETGDVTPVSVTNDPVNGPHVGVLAPNGSIALRDGAVCDGLAEYTEHCRAAEAELRAYKAKRAYRTKASA